MQEKGDGCGRQEVDSSISGFDCPQRIPVFHADLPCLVRPIEIENEGFNRQDGGSQAREFGICPQERKDHLQDCGPGFLPMDWKEGEGERNDDPQGEAHGARSRENRRGEEGQVAACMRRSFQMDGR